jgi:hypothetical protein
MRAFPFQESEAAMPLKALEDLRQALKIAAGHDATYEERSRAAAALIAVGIQILDVPPRESAAWLRAIAEEIERQSAARH